MIYNNFLERYILPFGDSLVGSSFMSELTKWRKTAGLSSDEIDSLSLQKLEEVLTFATTRSPFYKKYASLRHKDPVQWLKSFPVIDKNTVNDDLADILTCPKEKLIASYSSGSSGTQGVVYMDKHEQSTTRAIQTLCWEWGGYYLGKPLVQTGMTLDRGPIKKIKDLFLKTRYCSAFGLAEGQVRKILDRQRKQSNYHLGGYASSLYILASTAIEIGIKDVSFDAALSWGDKLFSHYRQKIKDAFGCRVFDIYGISEGMVIAAQKDLEYYYIFSPHVYLEILDNNDNEVPAGTLGRVVVTRLDGYSMPLIRYSTGDLAIKLPLDKYPTKKEFGFPLLERIIGRDTDIVRTASGKYMIVHFFTAIFEHYPQIKQFKVIQRDLGSIEIEYIRGREFNTAALKSIENQVNNYLNEEYPICWKEVSTIYPTKSGKPQIIQSLLKDC